MVPQQKILFLIKDCNQKLLKLPDLILLVNHNVFLSEIRLTNILSFNLILSNNYLKSDNSIINIYYGTLFTALVKRP